MEYILLIISVVASIIFFFHIKKLERSLKHQESMTQHRYEERVDADRRVIDRNIELSKVSTKLVEIEEQLEYERARNEEILSQKKSSETRLGQISEHIVPFLSECPYEPKDMHFLGSPIDYIVFDFDEGSIHFLEVKSGNSKESKRQKLIKNIIKAGKVYYNQIRISEKGVKTKTSENS